jgi:hypothetical protein
MQNCEEIKLIAPQITPLQIHSPVIGGSPSRSD